MKGLPRIEIEWLLGCLARLARHVRHRDVAITGGVAIQFGLAVLGYAGSRETIADLDLVASSLDAVSETVVGPFLISHYHVPQPDVPKFMIQLVDPVSRIRVDIFPDLVGSLKRAQRITIGEQTMNLLCLADILEHKLLTLSKASPVEPVDPKHYLDAHAIGAVLGRTVPSVPAAFLAKDVYGVESDRACRRCELSKTTAFPLAPKQQIFHLLGWPYAAAQQNDAAANRRTKVVVK